MKKKEFELTIFQPSRILFGLFLSPVVVIGSILLGAELQSFLIPILLITLYLFTFYHFSIGYLTVLVNEEEIEFNWREKIFFNFKDIQPVSVSEIKNVVIDNGELLRKIKTQNRIIQLGTAKIQQKDAAKFISELRNISKRNGARIIDSWDEWFAKGYLKIAYRINTVILIIASIIFTIMIVKKGFDAKMLSLTLLLIPQMFLYGIQMKRKLKNKTTGNSGLAK